MLQGKYWNQNIPVLPENKNWDKKESVKIGKTVYYGKSLEGRHWEKAKIIACIVGVISLSFLIVPIPFFASKDIYRNTGRRIREIRYNRKLKFIEGNILSKSNKRHSTKTSSSDSVKNQLPVKDVPIRQEVLDLFGGKDNFEKIPVLDVSDRAGWTGYINFIRPDELSHPIMRGVDKVNRPFFVIRAENAKTSDLVTVTYFQRYSDDIQTWAQGGDGKNKLSQIVFHREKELEDLKSLIENRRV